MNKKDIEAELTKLIFESGNFASWKESRKFLKDGISEVVDELRAERLNKNGSNKNNIAKNLSVNLNVNTLEAMTELVQVESKLERINQLLGEINGKFKNENTIKIGVEVNE